MVSGLPAGTNYFIVRTFTPAHVATFPTNCSGGGAGIYAICLGTTAQGQPAPNNPNDLTSVNSAEVSATIVGNGSSVNIAGGNVTITENGNSTNDTITLSCTSDPDSLVINDPNNPITGGPGTTQSGPNTVFIALAQLNPSSTITVNTLGGNDTLTVNLSGCDIIPGGGLFFNGGLPTTAPGDRLDIVGGNQGTVTYNYTNASDGSVVMSSFGTIHYTGLEPISNTGTASDVIFNLPAAASNAVLEDDGTSGNSQSRLRSVNGTFETTDFSNPSGSVTINRGNAADTLAVSALPDLNSSITIGGASTQFATVTFNGAVSLAANKNLTAFATGTVSLPNMTSDIDTTGTGAISLTTATNISLAGGSSLTTVDGALTLSANRQMTPSSGTFAGVALDAASITTTGSGNVLLTGLGGDAGAANHGVFLQNGASISSTSGAIGAGTITLDGDTSTADVTNARGVFLTDAGTLTTSVSGAIHLTGDSFSNFSSDRRGVQLSTGAAVTSTGTGANAAGITLTGTAARSSGVYLESAATLVSTVDGPIQITGTGGAGGSSHGIILIAGPDIRSTGTGSITLNGTASALGTGGNGVDIRSPGTIVSAAEGSVSFIGAANGTGNANTGISMSEASVVESTGINAGNVTLTGTGSPNGSNINYGVHATGSGTQIRSVSGDIGLTGTGGTASSSILLEIDTTIDSTGLGAGAAKIKLTGNTPSGDATAVELRGEIDSVDGLIEITGTGAGAGNFRHGIVIISGFIRSTGTGANAGGIVLNGTGSATGGDSNFGISMFNATTISTVDGPIQMTGMPGVGASSAALSIGGMVTSTGTGDLTAIGDQIALASPAAINVGAGNFVTLTPKRAGQLINLGGADAVGTLGLTDAEIAIITAGTLNIGDANSGTITTTADITRASATNMTVASGGDVVIGAGQIDTGGGTLLLDPGTSPFAVKPVKSLTDVTASTLSFGSDLAIVINGTTADTQYTQLNVAGIVNLTGVTLVLSGTHTPTTGQQFTIVENDAGDAIVGTFNGLIEGAPIANFLGSGITANISYFGGSGNDVVITVETVPPTVTSTTPLQGATGVDRDGDITLDFSEPVNIAAAGITLNCGGVQAFSPTLPQNGVTSIVINPDNTLPAGILCTVTAVSANITDLAGNQLDGGTPGPNFVLTFTTACTNPTVVTTNADSGPGSLRQAVNDACPNSTITFDMNTVVSPIGLSSGQIEIDKNLTIQGPGADLLTVQNTATPGIISRVFDIPNSSTVRITDLTVAGGNVTGSGLNGSGGGIRIDGGSVSLERMAIEGNTSAGAGGGILCNAGAVNITDSTISGNTASGSNGGGLQNNCSGPGSIVNSTVSGNTAGEAGGGIRHFAGSLLITNSTITNNTGGSGGSGVSQVTGTVTVRSTIIAGNMNNAVQPDVEGLFTSKGYNLIGNVGTATGFTTTGDQTGTGGAGVLNPQLGSLQNNGGTTETHALAPTSPAVDKGSAFALTTDQRGSVRPFDIPTVANAADGSDIGAYELNTVPTTTTVSSSNNPSVWGETVTFTATVETDPGGAPVTVGNVDFSLDGNPVAACQNVALNGSGQAQCAISGLALGGHTILAEYDENLPFLASSGSLIQTVNKANTTIQITGDTPDPTLIGDPYVVTWTVAVVAPGAGTPTGTVTITDGTGGTCTAPVATGFCTMTSTTVGVKNLVATYSGDAFFNGSVSAVEQHTVVIRISGTIRQAPGMTPLAGITVTLTGANGGGLALTNSNGEYTFFGTFSGNYTVTPSGPIPGKSYDPISRILTNVTGHTTGIDFVAYDTSTDAPRKLKVISQFAVPGSAVTVPVTIQSQGNETSISFSIEFDPAIYSAPPTVGCGTDAGPGCTITTNYTQPGRVGIRVVPASVPLTAGTREIVKLNFQTQPTLASNTPIDLIVTPTNIAATNANGDLLLVELFSGGLIVMQQGLEGDVANSVTGDGQVLSNDVIVARQFAVGTRTANPAYNEFQRVDIAPAATKGDGMITSADVIQARRYASGIDAVKDAGGPFMPMTAAPPPAMLTMGEANRGVKAMPTNGVAGYQVTVPVEMKTAGDEVAVSFTLEYDAMKLGNPKVTLAGVAPADAVVTVNDTESGRLTILVDAGTPFSKAGGHLLNVTFDVAQTAPAGDTKIAIKSGSFSDAEANELEAAYASGTVTINGANAPSVRISGRVLTPSGGGLRNAQVTITDADGTRRTVLTSSAGYYQFDSVATGRQYRLSVSSRRYRFATRTVEISADLADIDFIAQE